MAMYPSCKNSMLRSLESASSNILWSGCSQSNTHTHTYTHTHTHTHTPTPPLGSPFTIDSSIPLDDSLPLALPQEFFFARLQLDPDDA